MKPAHPATTALALLLLAAPAAHAQELRIGLQDDADILDPDQSRTFVGRIVYTALCDKLVDIDPALEIVPSSPPTGSGARTRRC
jgi:peptide/nickel transport system substrate-binding protein